MERGRDPIEGGGGGAGVPLEARVGALEAKVDRIEATLLRLKPRIAEMVGELRLIPKVADYASLRADVAEIKGRLANMPTTWTLISFAVGSCMASAGLAFTIAKLLG